MQEIFRSADFVSIQFRERNLGQPQSSTIPALDDYQVTYIAGLAVGESFAIESKLSYRQIQNLKLSEFQDALGEWMAIAERKLSNFTEFLVLGDSSGYCPVFYAEFQNHLIIADTFIGAVHGLNHVRARPELDIAHYIASLFPAHPHFDNPSVHRTMSANIKILGIDDALLVQDTGPKIVSRPATTGTENTSYEDLLVHGSHLVKSTIKQLSKVEGLQKVLSLSGGVDSRLALSMISTSGFAGEFEISSVDPRTWKNKKTVKTIERDIAIADKIRTDFGLNWSTVGEREFLPFDFRDSLNFHQSYKSNFAHAFSASPGHMVQSDLKVTFRGGGGELLRSTLTGDRISEQILNGTQELTPELGFTAWYMSKSPVATEEHPLIQEYVSTTFKSVPGNSLIEKLNELYRRTRNRTHFGHVRQSGSTNNYAFHPLSNQYFHQASRMLSFEERSTGKLVRDLFLLNEPSLLNLPFENEDSTKGIANVQARDVHIAQNEWVKPLDRAKAARIKSKMRKGWTHDERLISTTFSKMESSRIFTAQSMKLLEDFVEADVKRILRRVNNRAYEHTKTNVPDALSLCSKVASALDVFIPSQPKGSHVHLFTSIPERDTETSISKVRIKYPVRPQDGWNNQSVPAFTTELTVKNDTATVSISHSAMKKSAGEYAVYFYKNKKLVQKSWYDSRNLVSFKIEGPGIYSAQVFYRINSAHRTTLGMRTNEVLID